jgi:hypothetical protein
MLLAELFFLQIKIQDEHKFIEGAENRTGLNTEKLERTKVRGPWAEVNTTKWGF